jgi:DNA-binding CsgD family transcriptional regulator
MYRKAPHEQIEVQHDIQDLAKSVSGLAAALDSERLRLRANDSGGLEPQQKERIVNLADGVISIARMGLLRPPSKKWEFAQYSRLELEYMSRGITETQASSMRNISLQTIKGRLVTIKKYFGTNTRSQMVSEAINRGFLAIEPDASDCPEISSMNLHVLSFAASGSTTAEIAGYYDISSNTVGRHYEEVRAKLGARSMPHAVRRAYELGLFKVGEAVPGLESDIHMLELRVIGEPLAEPIQIRDHREAELLKAASALGTGYLNTEEALKAGLFEDFSEVGRANAFGRKMVDMDKRLRQEPDSPVISKRKIRLNGKRTYIYAFNQQLVFEDIDGRHEIPAFGLPESSTLTPNRRVARKRRSSPNKRPQTRPKPVEESPKPPEQLNSEAAPEPLADLPPLERVLESLNPRDPEEVFTNLPLKRALDYIGRQHVIDYRAKVVLALRYGIPPGSLRLENINRDGRPVSLSKIGDSVPPYQGLDLESTYLISGLDPTQILTTELSLVRDYKDKMPALASIEDQLKAELKRLKQSKS